MAARKQTSIKVPSDRLKKAMKEAKKLKGTFSDDVESLIANLKK